MENNQPKQIETRWMPLHDDLYFYLAFSQRRSGLTIMTRAWLGDNFDMANYLTGNCYMTFIEANNNLSK